ncbi:MAG TPA: OsmC family protein [Thermoplasmata archaeon]|jgi:osmotically inducible protein OsmC
MERKGSAVWRGRLRDGKGTVSTGSGALSDVRYSFSMRFEQEPGTNPEELIAAAHASCFSMALSAELEKAKMVPDHIRTTATATFEKVADAWTISRIHLNTVAKVPGAEESAFRAAAERAKVGCPVSRVLKAAITMDARLES